MTIDPAGHADEQELVDGLHGDDPGALATLFDRYGDRIHNHCFRHLADWSEAEDATASVFLEVWHYSLQWGVDTCAQANHGC